jgi:hypothetical protein
MTARAVFLLAVVAVVAACAKSPLPEFEARRAAALAVATDVPARWQPDAVLTLRGALVADVIAAAITRAGALERKIDLAGSRTFVRPTLKIDRLSVSSSPTCEACLRVDTALSGELSWQVAASSGAAPMSGALVFDAVLAARRDDDGFVVTLQPRDVAAVTLELGGRTYEPVRRLAEGAVASWVRDDLLSQIGPLVIARIPDVDLPLRAARVRPYTDGVRLELLSQVPVTAPVQASDPGRSEAWALAVSTAALEHVARAHAFAHGPVSHGVVVEPTRLHVADDRFDLGLRLWRTTGRGWWRDVQVTGTVEPTTRGFALRPTEATEVARSKGARLVDPLAALAEGAILRGVERAVATTLPGGTDGIIAGVPIEMRVERFASAPDTLVIAGTSAVGEAHARPARGDSRR